VEFALLWISPSFVSQWTQERGELVVARVLVVAGGGPHNVEAWHLSTLRTLSFAP